MPTKKKEPSGSPKGKKTPRAKRAAPPAKKSIPPNAKAPSSRRLTPIQSAEASVQARVGVADLGRVWIDVDKLLRAKLRVSCVRADDLLVCDFVFENLELDKTGQGAPKLVRTNPNAATLIVEFPPQSFGEEAKLDKPGEPGQEIPANLTGKEEFREKFPNPEDEAPRTFH